MAEGDNSSSTPLHTSASCGDIEEVRKLLKTKQYSVNTVNDVKCTPLHLACLNGQLDMVYILVNEFNADMSALDKRANTPLCLAATNGNVQIVLTLIILSMFGRKCGDQERVPVSHNVCSANITEEDMLKKLIVEYFHDVEAIKKSETFFLLKFRDLFDSTGDEGFMPLFLAASFGYKDIIEKFARDYGSNLKSNGFFELSLLHCACFGGHLQLVDSLISDYCCDPLSKDKGGSSILHYAALGESIEVIEFLLTATTFKIKYDAINNARETPLCLAVLSGHRKTMQTLISQYNCNPCVLNANGQSLLHYACRGGHTDLCDEIINHWKLDPTAGDQQGNTPLHLAVWHGHTKTAEILITKYKVDIDCHNAEGLCPLTLAAQCGHTDMVQLLIEEFNCNPYIQDSKGWTLLHYASKSGHVEMLNILGSVYGLDPSGKCFQGSTPLHVAAEYGQTDSVKCLILQHKVDVDTRDNDNSTPLCLAGRNGHKGTVNTLIKEFGASPHVAGYQGQSLLHYCCEGGHIELIRILVKEYPLIASTEDINGDTLVHIAAALHRSPELISYLIAELKLETENKNINGATPLCLAAVNGHTDILQVLICEFKCNTHVRGTKRRTLLHYACIGGHPSSVNKLITEYALDPTERDDDGNTPLHIAAKQGYIELSKLLITKYKVPTEVTNNKNLTPLCLAAGIGHQRLVEVLIRECNCNTRIKGFNGYTLLHCACFSGQITLVSDLLSDFQLDPLARDDSGDTPAHVAAAYGHIGIIGLLNAFNVNIHTKNSAGNTVLHQAVLSNNNELIDTLITELGCNPEVCNNKGWTILHLACYHGSPEVVQCLLGTHGMSVFSTDEDGNTPLHIAVASQHLECIHVLLQHNAPLSVRNKSGAKPIRIAEEQSNKDIENELREYSKSDSSSTYKEQQKISQECFSGEKRVTKLFIVGHQKAGKTTLIETLKKESFMKKVLGGTTVAPPRTAGIVPSTHDSDRYGRMVFYDFAGDREYYSSHGAILKILDTSEGVNVFLILCNLNQDNDTICSRYGYWLSFLLCNPLSPNSFILPVGSHADRIEQISIPKKLEAIDKISSNFCETLADKIDIKNAIALDCRKTGAHINHIRKLAKKASSSIPEVRLTLEASTLLGLLLKDFATVPAFKLQRIISHIALIQFRLPSHPPKLYSLVKELHNLGLVLIVAKEGDPIENHFIILKISHFTSEVHSRLFSDQARKELAKHTDKLKLSVGIIPELLLKKILPEYITKECLIKLQYCQEIENVNVEQDFTLTQSTQESTDSILQNPFNHKSLLFFPGLCELEKEDLLLLASLPLKSCALGWYAKCEGQFDYFPPRFLHVLIVHLSLNFALKQHLPTNTSITSEVHKVNHRCHVWKTGLHWLMENGVEVFVDLPSAAESKELIVVTSSDDEYRAECVDTLQKVVQKVTEVKTEFCHHIRPTVYLLDPLKLQDESFTSASSVPKYTLGDVEAVLTERKQKAVSVDGFHSVPSTEFMKLPRWKMSYWNIVFPINGNEVESAIENVIGSWKHLGMNLSIHPSILEEINCDHQHERFSGVGQKKRKMIQIWMTGQSMPSWSSLAEALRSPSVDQPKLAEKISQEHDVPLQDKILREDNSTIRPATDMDFLRSFAALIGSRWQCFASPLSLTSEDIVSIKRETRGAEPTRQALAMLQKWASSETATYGQLREKLCALSVFQL